MSGSETTNLRSAHSGTPEPPLHKAARTGDHAAIRALAAAGADLNAVYGYGRDAEGRSWPATPLMLAAGSDDGATDATVKLLLELGANPSIVLRGISAATCALEGLRWISTQGGDAARAEALLRASSPLPGDLEDANRVLCDIAGNGDASRLRVLLAHGLSAKGHWDGQAARERERRIEESLSRYRSAETDPLASLPEETRASFAESFAELEAQDFERRCSAPSSFEIPLFRAAESGSVECVRLLLAAGADPMVRDSQMQTALYRAGSLEVIRELMQVGLPLEDTDRFQWTPLRYAISDGEEAFPRVRALIDAGANVNATYDRGFTIFMSAVASGRHPALLRLLVDKGADPHAVSELGYNAFHAAIDVNGEANAEESVRDTFSYLKELGVNLEQRTSRGLTPLALAIEAGGETEVRVLCEVGADPNARCPRDRCAPEGCERPELPLLVHAASGVGVDPDVKTDALLRAGADPLATDAHGFTALTYVVAELCENAPDRFTAHRECFDGIRAIPPQEMPLPATRDAFLAAVTPLFRAYAEQFAATIPISGTSPYDETRRAQNISCMVSLCAAEAWARRERREERDTASP